MVSDNCSNRHGLSKISRKSDDVSEYYDNWAEEYDKTLSNWHYEAPGQVASILRTELNPSSAVLDKGCGTGLSGKALRLAGFTKIEGIDVFSRSPELASSLDVYRTLREVDMRQLPFPMESDSYDGLACVGVLTYLSERK